MWLVVKATERDGVTLKDGDIGEILEETRVDKRNGLILLSPMEHLLPNYRMRLIDQTDDCYYAITTSKIVDVIRHDNDNEIQVVTRNTIYFLECVENEITDTEGVAE